jgi:hypothetical protein
MTFGEERLDRATLVSVHDRNVRVAFDKAGDLVFDGEDFGPLLKELMGRDEYEFRYRVPASEVATFAALVGINAADPIRGLAEHWMGDTRFYELQELMRATTYITYSSY